MITFPTNVQTIADTLPNCPQDLPIIRLVSGNNNFKFPCAAQSNFECLALVER